MTEPRKINVMISSRVQSRFRDANTRKQVTLGAARAALKAALEAELLFGQPLFEVWLSDDPEDQSSGRTEPALEGSLKQVRAADIVLVLYNGEAGWAFPNHTRGICHLEFLEAWNKERPKLGIVRIGSPIKSKRKSAAPQDAAKAQAEDERDKAFRQDVEEHRVPISASAGSVEEIVAFGKLKVREIAVELLVLGRLEASRAAYSEGAPLDWSRLDFARRKQQMEDAIGTYLEKVELNPIVKGLPQGHVRTLSPGAPVLFVCHGIPSAMSVGAAREMVGQPFLRDHEYMAKARSRADKPIGPVHLIACTRTVTESQAIRQLGFPDATIVKTRFGVYVADHVQMIQMVFLADCNDAGATRDAVAAFFEWLHNAEEERRFCQRAEGRRLIVQTMIDLQQPLP